MEYEAIIQTILDEIDKRSQKTFELLNSHE